MSRFIRIENVEISEASIQKPVAPFGIDQYEVLVSTNDQSKANALEGFGITVRESGGLFKARLRRLEMHGKVAVFDSNEIPYFDDVPDGSKGTVIIEQLPFEIESKSGFATRLHSVHIQEFAPPSSPPCGRALAGERSRSSLVFRV